MSRFYNTAGSGSQIGGGRNALTAVVVGLFAAGLGSAAEPRKKERAMNHVRGPFDVKLTPQTLHAEMQGPPFEKLGRMSIDKTFHGGLDARSRGEMLSSLTDVKGSAGYVAIERVDGSLDGRKGTFVLQHSGTMASGNQSLTITVVPDSGTGQLAGLEGRMAIVIDAGKHAYDFEYTLPEAP